MKNIQIVNSKAERSAQIGIFGWTGTGKTTFLALLYCILNKGKIPGVNFNYRKNDTNTSLYIEKYIQLICGPSGWEEISKISGTTANIELFFDLFFKRKTIAIKITDYRGEDTEFTKERDISHLVKCDAIMIFLQSKQSTIRDEFCRHSDFSNFLNRLHRNIKDNRIDIPVILVITKYDYFTQRINNIDTLIEREQIFKEAYNTLKECCKKISVYAISSKECYEHYIKQSNSEPCLPDYYDDITIDAKNISIPFLRMMDEILKKEDSEIRKEKLDEIVKFIKPVIKVGFYIVGFIFVIYGILFGYTSHVINSLDSYSEDKYVVYNKYVNFSRESNTIFLFPWLMDKVKLKQDTYKKEAEREKYKKIISISSNYNEVKSLCESYFDLFPDGTHKDEVKKIYDSSWEKEESAKFAIIKDRAKEKEIDDVINNANYYITSYPNGKYIVDAKAMREEAVAVNGIQLESDYKILISKSNLYMNKYHDGDYIDLVKILLEEATIVKNIEDVSSNYTQAISLSGNYLSNYKDGKFKKLVEKIKKEAEEQQRLASIPVKDTPPKSCLGSGMLIFTIFVALMTAFRELIIKDEYD